MLTRSRSSSIFILLCITPIRMYSWTIAAAFIFYRTSSHLLSSLSSSALIFRSSSSPRRDVLHFHLVESSVFFLTRDRHIAQSFSSFVAAIFQPRVRCRLFFGLQSYILLFPSILVPFFAAPEVLSIFFETEWKAVSLQLVSF